ncbi:myoD family inhibitor isoform X2 [Pleurodeles waltl]|uniref:myoD family inhibitor isoform X2 n=1 Tax=Pleurodeles waltl TaxID=8319 RepID=UPI003709BF5F
MWARQSETPVQGSPAALFNRDKILGEALTRGWCNEEEQNDRSKDETPQCSAATGQEPTGAANLHSTACDAQERTSRDQTQPTSANEKPTEDESLLSSADERPHEGKPLLSSPNETPYQDKASKRSTAEGEEQQGGEKALLNTLNHRHFLVNFGNSVPGSSPGPITSQPKDQYLMQKLELDATTACAPLLRKDPIIISEPGRGKPSTANGVLPPLQPVVTRPQKTHGKLQSHPSLNSQSSKRSKGSSKSSSSQLQSAAQEDCCAHCILACLFCEFLVLCNIALDCATCGSCSSDESCFCCCCGCGECGDCEVPCDMDCGIVDACCESADCLEICMECCGLCFSS